MDKLSISMDKSDFEALATKLGLSYKILEFEINEKNLDIEDVNTVLMSATGKYDAMTKLREMTGLSYQAIADASNMSRQRCHQVIGPIGDRAIKIQPGEEVLEDTQEKIFKEAATSPDAWTKSGRLKRAFVIRHLTKAGFGKTKAALVAGQLKRPKAAIIMFGLLDIPFNEHEKWLRQQQADGVYQVRVWENINNKTPVNLSQMAFCRYCHSLGVSERERNGKG